MSDVYLESEAQLIKTAPVLARSEFEGLLIVQLMSDSTAKSPKRFLTRSNWHRFRWMWVWELTGP